MQGGDTSLFSFLEPRGVARYSSFMGGETQPLKPKGSRRRHQRYEQKLLVKHRCVAPSLSVEEAFQVGIIEDVSSGGLMMKVKKAYVTGSIFEIRFPDSPPFPNKTLFGEVTWLFRLPEADQYRVGCKFVKFGNS